MVSYKTGAAFRPKRHSRCAQENGCWGNGLPDKRPRSSSTTERQTYIGKHEDEQTDLSFCNLVQANLTHANLTGALTME